MSPGRLPYLADAADLVAWAQRVEARTEFPRLIRRLIRQTNDQVVTLEMRAAEGGGYAGYDGRVQASRATPFVPAGLSVWELGVGEDPEIKAERDYVKRTNDPLDVDKTTTTFVSVSARRWPGKAAWVAAKRAERKWADVQALDADDLEIAFEAAPAAHFWFSEVVGKPASGVRSIEEWWDAFSRATNPNLTPSLILFGRADPAAALLRLLEQETRITTVSAASTDDVLAFVAATLHSVAEPARSDLLARTLIVQDAISLRLLDRSANLLILLPFVEELRRDAQLVRANHVVLLAPSGVPADITLLGVDRDQFSVQLQALGVPEADATRLAQAAHRSIVTFQNEAPGRGATARDWSSSLRPTIARRAWLMGGWNEGRSGDLDELARLLGTSYDAAKDTLRALATGGDPVFATVSSSWTLTRSENAWAFGRTAVDARDLSALEGVIQNVLGAVDPALELPPAERWKAALYGKTRIHSSDMRNGLANTLALAGAYGTTTVAGGSFTMTDWAAGVVARLLRRANEDKTGQLWQSLGDVLPTLAEAAPAVFLAAVQEGAAGDEPVLRQMFLDRDDDDGFFTSTPHTGLLWALESTAWSADHAALSAKLLARLAEIDPGGRLSNRPANSLQAFFRPWLPQTGLAAERRLTVLDGLRRDHNEVAWTLMMRALPRDAGGTYSHGPRFRQWRPRDESVTNVEYAAMTAAIAERILEDAGESAARWAEVVEDLSRFPSEQRELALARLEKVIGELT